MIMELSCRNGTSIKSSSTRRRCRRYHNYRCCDRRLFCWSVLFLSYYCYDVSNIVSLLGKEELSSSSMIFVYVESVENSIGLKNINYEKLIMEVNENDINDDEDDDDNDDNQDGDNDDEDEEYDDESTNTNNIDPTDNEQQQQQQQHDQGRTTTTLQEQSSGYKNRIDELRNILDTDTNVHPNDLIGLNPDEATETIINTITQSLYQRMNKMFTTKAVSAECRAKIGQHMKYFIHAIGMEESLPFSDVTFPSNECNEPVYDFRNMPDGMHIGHVQNRTYQPPRTTNTTINTSNNTNDTTTPTTNNSTDNNSTAQYIDDPDQLKLCYGILTHDDPIATMRLIESLNEKDELLQQYRHEFVIHVDAKYETTQSVLLEYASNYTNIHILDNTRRVRVNWGGFSMVNATLQILQYIFNVNTNHEDNDSNTTTINTNESLFTFHKFVHISSSTYPIASNTEIRYKLSSYPLDANFLHVIMQPTRATPYVWNYFVECDDSIHRIYQLPVLRDSVHGANIFTSSQWFISSYEYSQYLALAPPGSFVHQYLSYAEHVVVADEAFFGTVLRHTKFCYKHHNTNFLHLQFDRWESELPQNKRDERKCPMPNPNHCGRSPTIMTIDYADIMELSDNLFARKFDSKVDNAVKDVVDEWRTRREGLIKNGADPLHVHQMKQLDFEGHGVLIVARETIHDDVPLCMALPSSVSSYHEGTTTSSTGSGGNKIQLVPCFEEWVPQTLAPDWETGAVILNETMPYTRWEIGPCTSDGELIRLANGEIHVTLGSYSTTGPRCMFKQMDGIRAGRCYDGGPEKFQPGGKVQVYPCTREWYQFLSFGRGDVDDNATTTTTIHSKNTTPLPPKNSLFATIPSHIVKQIHNLGHTEQSPYMCLGVRGRGDNDEIDWDDEEYAQKKRNIPRTNEATTTTIVRKPLSEWIGQNIWSTHCSNNGAVIDWAFVPFISDDAEVEMVVRDDDTINETTSSTTTNSIESTISTDEL